MQFARENYKSVVYMNFKNNNSLKRVFDSDFDVNRMTKVNLAAFPVLHFCKSFENHARKYDAYVFKVISCGP